MTLSSLVLATAAASTPWAGHEASCSACSHPEHWKDHLPPLVSAAIHRVDKSTTPLSWTLDGLAAQNQAGDSPAPAVPSDPAAEQARKALERDIQKDIEMGKKYAEEVAKDLKFSEDQAMIKRVETIGGELAAIANSFQAEATWGDKRPTQFPYTFKVVKDKDVNAFSIPGGFIYVYEGLLNFAESDDELAGVLAHEISHASFRHVAELQRRSAKIDLLQIPLILAAILTRSQEGMAALTGATLAGQAFRSGWSLNAETAADWGAVQYIRRSRYNPVGVLTFMERLAYRDQANAQINWGIYATHPPSRERAQTITNRLKQLGVPILRSSVTTSLRATTVIADDQGIDFFFGKVKLHTFRGEGAIARSEQAVSRMNRFTDSSPGLEQVSRDGYVIRGGGRPLFEVKQEDILPGQELDGVFTETLNRFRAVIFDLNYRLWNQHGSG